MNNNPLSAILDDPEAMKKIASIASEFAGGAPQTASTDPDSAPSTTAPAAPVSAPVSNMAPDPAAELMQRAIPLLSSIAKSGQNAVDSDRLRLLSALKPFVSTSTSSQLDHAARLLSIAHMTRTAAVQVLAPDSSAKEV